MSGTSPVFVKQLLPAVVLVAAGALVLSQVSQPASTPSVAAYGETPVNAEAVFTSTPRAVAEEPSHSATTRTVQKPKPVASAAAPRKPEPAPIQQAAVGAPLSITPPPEQVQTAPATNDTGIMGTLRNVGTSVQQMPGRAYSRVTGWFSSDATPRADTPPRPPAEIPQNKAEM